MSSFANEYETGPRSTETILRVRIGENVHRLRVDQDLNKKTFAKIAGISRPLLNKIERGEADLRMSYIIRIADVLSVTPVDLITDHKKRE